LRLDWPIDPKKESFPLWRGYPAVNQELFDGHPTRSMIFHLQIPEAVHVASVLMLRVGSVWHVPLTWGARQ
jgi:hypothetical protein